MRNEDGWVRCSDTFPSPEQSRDSHGDFTIFWVTIEQTGLNGKKIRYGKYAFVKDFKWYDNMMGRSFGPDEVVVAWRPKFGLYQGPI